MRSALRLFFILLSLLSGVQSYAGDKINDNLIVPGERVGAITKRSIEADLKTAISEFDIRRVIHEDLNGTFCATEIYPNSEKKLRVLWNRFHERETLNQSECDKTPFRTKPYSVVLYGSHWRTEQGVHIGTNLIELEQINNAPVDFNFSETCESGSIISWNAGNLAKYKNELEYIRLRTPDLGKYGTGQKISSSELPRKLKKEIYIQSFDIYFSAD